MNQKVVFLIVPQNEAEASRMLVKTSKWVGNRDLVIQAPGGFFPELSEEASKILGETRKIETVLFANGAVFFQTNGRLVDDARGRDVIEVLDEARYSLGDFSKKVASVRVQCCYTGGFFERYRRDTEEVLRRFESDFPIKFSAPNLYSHVLKGLNYKDTEFRYIQSFFDAKNNHEQIVADNSFKLTLPSAARVEAPTVERLLADERAIAL